MKVPHSVRGERGRCQAPLHDLGKFLSSCSGRMPSSASVAPDVWGGARTSVWPDLGCYLWHLVQLDGSACCCVLLRPTVNVGFAPVNRLGANDSIQVGLSPPVADTHRRSVVVPSFVCLICFFFVE
ncbi:hypothetical protein SETIT_3G110600v2 [Setaria italica]|uniref:Uncharacterized protein n=1 Tax=Setaria italica TaxID=4555 RepID=K3ZGI4_SETIT|nr:hypothetical protein SETIT_3G110600v2 [Setaria italica]